MGTGSPGGGRLLCRWFAPGLAGGVPRGESFLPGCNAILRGWLRALARRGWQRVLTRRAHARPAWGNLLRRDSPRPLSDLFTPPKHPFWRNFFGDGSPLPRLGAASGKWASPGPSPVVGRKPNNPLGAPEAGMTSSGDGRFPCRWFAPGLAVGVSRGEVILTAPTHPCASGGGPLPAGATKGRPCSRGGLQTGLFH